MTDDGSGDGDWAGVVGSGDDTGCGDAGPDVGGGGGGGGAVSNETRPMSRASIGPSSRAASRGTRRRRAHVEREVAAPVDGGRRAPLRSGCWPPRASPSPSVSTGGGRAAFSGSSGGGGGGGCGGVGGLLRLRRQSGWTRRAAVRARGRLRSASAARFASPSAAGATTAAYRARRANRLPAVAASAGGRSGCRSAHRAEHRRASTVADGPAARHPLRREPPSCFSVGTSGDGSAGSPQPERGGARAGAGRTSSASLDLDDDPS